MSSNTFLRPQIYIPGFLLITNISNSNPMIVSITDSDQNTYVVGQLVHLNVPSTYKMFQADQLTGEILAINGTDFTVNINSSSFDAFVAPGLGVSQPATLAPAGSRNMELDNTKITEPFHALSNSGN